MARREGPKPGEWRYTVGEVPHRLTAYERTDRGLDVYTRVWDGDRYTAKRRLRGPIRDDDGRVDPDLALRAQEAALARQRSLADGLDAEAAADAGPLTLARGFAELLHEERGKYAGKTRWRRDVERHRDVILSVLPRDLLWSRVRHAHYRTLWRHMAAEHRRTGDYGPRVAEQIVGSLQTAALWLQQEGRIEPGDAQPAHGWRRILQNEWEDITDRPIGKPSRPRYTVEEQRKLWAALPRADPRLALAVEIGAELRLGQVPRSRRSDVFAARGFAIGGVRVHGRGKKLGEDVVFTTAQRHTLARAMTSGVLADLERAYRSGEIEDYYLIPGGYLRTVRGRRGRPVKRAPVENAGRRLSRGGLTGQWRTLETLAGVEDVDGRLWYGLRRLHSDLAEDVEGDQRVLNRLGAWKHTQTRQLYQQEGRAEINEAAARARAKIRPKTRRGNDLEERS